MVADRAMETAMDRVTATEMEAETVMDRVTAMEKVREKAGEQEAAVPRMIMSAFPMPLPTVEI